MKRILIILFCMIYVITDMTAQNKSITFGAERMDILLPALRNKRVALVINQTSIVGNGQTLLIDTLLFHKINVKKVFAPEHGFRGTDDAGETVTDSKDPKTGIPIVSIYGKNKKPTPEQLSDIDVVVFDIQDVGTRFFTYISSMHYIMEACLENQKQMIVCDRPNPNDYIDGPVLQKDCQSFVGMHPIPILHGLTIAELALMINGEGWLSSQLTGKNNQCDLLVIPMTGWQHGQPYELPVKPSPNLPSQQAIRLYPSLCLFEATPISIGRGTVFPFQVIGAPDKKYGSFTFTPQSLPGWDKNPLHQDKTCYGVDLRNIEFQGGFSLEFFISFLKKSGQKSSFISRSRWFELLSGNKTLKNQILSGMEEAEIRASWKTEINQYKEIRKKYILYNDFLLENQDLTNLNFSLIEGSNHSFY